MLHEFIAANREMIIQRTREQIESRPWPSVSNRELEQGVPLFLTQVSETLRLKRSGEPFSDQIITSTAARHGAELLRAGFNVSQVVHDYGDICQAITELAIERSAPITVEEFHTLNRCLDTAIAGAVGEHARVTAQTGASSEVERVGHAAHELRDVLNTALLAFHMLKRGAVAINGSTGEVLGRSLMGLRDLVDRTVSEVRLTKGEQLRERLDLMTFLDEIAAAGMLHSEYRHIEFTVQPVEPGVAIDGDAQLLTSAVMNLLHNAFKNTPSGGHVVLRARPKGRRLVIEIEDQCGGIPEAKGDLLKAAADAGAAASGIGHGLTIARKAIQAHGGDIQIRNMPGKGCVFSLDVPLAADAVPAPAI